MDNVNIPFIDSILKILYDGSLPEKKSFFIDNQEKITSTLEGLKTLSAQYKEKEDAGIIDENANELNSLIFSIEEGIKKFQEELITSVSNPGNDDKIVIDDDDCNVCQDSLNNISVCEEQPSDEFTDKIRKDLNQNVQNNKNFAKRNNKQQKMGYLITSEDYTQSFMVPGVNLSKQELNNIIRNSGISKAKIFKLVEIPTIQKQIQTTITVIQ